MSNRRDTNERLALWSTYGNEKTCIGTHLIQGGYCCLHCGSNEPSEICFKEKVRHHSVIVEDYVDPDTRRAVKKFTVIGAPPPKPEKCKTIPLEVIK